MRPPALVCGLRRCGSGEVLCLMPSWPWESVVLSILSGILGVGLLLFAWRRQPVAAVVIFGGVGAALGGWGFDAMGLLPQAGVVVGALIGGLAGAHLYPALSALAVGMAGAILLGVLYWVLGVRRPLGADLLSEPGLHSFHAALAAHPIHPVLLCVLPAVGMLVGLLVALKQRRITGAVFSSLVGGFALTLSGMLLAGMPPTVRTALLLLQPGWRWLVALPLHRRAHPGALHSLDRGPAAAGVRAAPRAAPTSPGPFGQAAERRGPIGPLMPY